MINNTPYASVRTDADDTLVLDILTEAFRDDPISGWIFADLADRRRYLPVFFSAMLNHPAASRRTIGRTAAAIWLTLRPGQSLDENGGVRSAEGGTTAAEPASPFEGKGERLHRLGAALASHRPAVTTYDYLFAIGVLEQSRGAGVGTALLAEGLRRADSARRGVYLEASSEGSRALYLRHGFTDLCAPVRLAGAPPVWPMWRPAAS